MASPEAKKLSYLIKLQNAAGLPAENCFGLRVELIAPSSAFLRAQRCTLPAKPSQLAAPLILGGRGTANWIVNGESWLSGSTWMVAFNVDLGSFVEGEYRNTIVRLSPC